MPPQTSLINPSLPIFFELPLLSPPAPAVTISLLSNVFLFSILQFIPSTLTPSTFLPSPYPRAPVLLHLFHLIFLCTCYTSMSNLKGLSTLLSPCLLSITLPFHFCDHESIVHRPLPSIRPSNQLSICPLSYPVTPSPQLLPKQ